MAALSYPVGSDGSLGVFVTGVTPPAFTRAVSEPIVVLSKDFRLAADTGGTWTDRVMFKATPTSPEQPFANALVWVLRRSDGYLAWSGFSDANGYYTASRLENGVDYVAVGIDPRDAAHIPPGDPGLFKTVGAGPFTVPAA